MKKLDQNYSRHEILVFDLCEEIDILREQRDYYKQQFEEERALRSKMLHDNLESARKGIGQALSIALSVQDNPDGSLSISKEDRKRLAKQYNTVIDG
jgi:hypothetical protein